MGSGRTAPHICKLLRKVLPQPIAVTTQYGAQGPLPSSHPLHKHERYFKIRSQSLLQLKNHITPHTPLCLPAKKPPEPFGSGGSKVVEMRGVEPRSCALSDTPYYKLSSDLISPRPWAGTTAPGLSRGKWRPPSRASGGSPFT